MAEGLRPVAVGPKPQGDAPCPFFAEGPVSVAYAVLAIVFSIDLDRL